MQRSSLSKQQIIYQSIVYFCGFLLFWEWLRPLEVISDTGSLTLFVIFTAFCFFLTLLKLSWWISMPLKVLGIIFIIDGLFITERLFSSSWFYVFYMHLQLNIELIINQQWTEMTSLFRSLLFLLLIWLMIYLLYYWFVVAKRVFLFVMLTFIYITVLDTFTIYQADAAIIRVFIISLIALGISNLLKEMDRESISFFKRESIGVWLIPLVGIILFVGAIGYASPKKDPQWPDPVPFITSTAENAGFNDGNNGTGTIQKVGYGEDDSNLGGSFLQDNTLVFEAAVQSEHYWRVESKDTYTGKGWESSSDQNFQEQVNGNITFDQFSNSVETEDRVAMIQFESGNYIGKLAYPYGVNSVVGEELVQYLLDHETGSIVAEGPEQQGIFDRYQVTYQYPSFSVNQLQRSSTNDPDQIKDKYLQLPNDLSDQVHQLSEDVTEDEESRYDKVKAIESYFGFNGFRYQTEDVAKPGPDDDYVEQFLFDTKVGYCDNFSTSMVVMLRTLDIPARWVKGFTGGEELEEQPSDVPEGMDVYQVTNSNAHSWVEVYFPEVGWVPFEPTQGFSGPTDFYQEATSAEEIEDEEEENTPIEQEEEDTRRDPLEEEEMGQSAGSNSTNSLQVSGPWLVSILSIVLLIALILYLTRYRWRTFILVRIYKKKQGVKVYQDAYHYLLKVLDHKGIKRGNGQTLRDYARDVDRKFESTDMSRLTFNYEQILYSKQAKSNQWEKMAELWENLIKQALS